MKIIQIVGEHKKGVKAKKYTKKTVNPSVAHAKAKEKLQPVGPVEETAIPGQMIGKVSKVDPATGKVDVQSPTGQTTTVDATQITPGDKPNSLSMQIPNVQPGMEVDAAKVQEEQPGVGYPVNHGPQPTANAGGRGPTPIVASKLWTAITPEVEAKAEDQGFRKVMLKVNGQMVPGLEGGDQRLGSKIIVVPSDFENMTRTGTAGTARRPMGVQSAEKTGIGAPPMRLPTKESADDQLLTSMLTIAGLR